MCSNPENVFYSDDKQGRGSRPGQWRGVCVSACMCASHPRVQEQEGGLTDGGREGEKVKVSAGAATPTYLFLSHPFSDLHGYKSK